MNKNKLAFVKANMSCSGQIQDIESLMAKRTTVKVAPPEHKNKNHVPPNEDTMIKFVSELVLDTLGLKDPNKDDIDKIGNKLKRKHHIHPSKSEIRYIYDSHFQHLTMPRIFHKWMVRKASRSDSGVLVVTITLNPDKFSCKYDCFYCPQETDLAGNHTQPRSYLSPEPAMQRAIQTKTSKESYMFDVMGQFQNRISTYKFNGSIDKTSTKPKKLEVILSGGTWHSYPEAYRNHVVTEVYWAANTMRAPRPIKTLEEEIELNETAEYRVIGLTAETRPDQITPDSIVELLKQGFTRIQLGEQTDNDAILKKVNRKCYVADSINAHRLLKQAGYKITVHLMPDLPGSSPDEDRRMLTRYATDPDLAHDDLKVYPTAICKAPEDTPDRIVYSKIGEWYEKGLYKPYAETNVNTLIDVIIDFLKIVPPWVRIERIVRDIPSKSITAGYNKMSNLRQMIMDKMVKNNWECNDIFNREIGDMELDDDVKPFLVVRNYKASQGDEYQISVEMHTMTPMQWFNYYVDRSLNAAKWLFTGRWNYWAGDLNSYKGLYGFCRLRIDPNPGGSFLPVLHGCGLLRELHVYGFSRSVGEASSGAQHRGYGKQMVKIAEMLTAQNNLHKVAIIAGVGTREYYKNQCSYKKEETYMKKTISPYNFYTLERIAALTAICGLLIATTLCTK